MWHGRVSTAVTAVMVCVAVVGMSLAARATMRLKKLNGDFRQEVSERFDLEAKIAAMEKEQAAATVQIKGLTNKLKDSEASLERMKAALEKERQEKRALTDALNKLQGATGGGSPAVGKT